MKSIEQIVSGMNLGQPDSVQEALAEALNDNGVIVGATVAVVGDPVYPFDGVKGVVREKNAGFALVEFPGGVKANLHTNLLVPVP